MGEKETSARTNAAAQPGDEDPDEAGTIVKSKSNITNNRGDEVEGRLAGGPEAAEAVNLNPSKSNREASSPGQEGERTSNLNLSKSN
jgi:hypothetical protein